MVIHFICRGNAFRSIIAEAYLNSLKIPNLSVISSGTVASRHAHLNQEVFKDTMSLLKNHGIEKYSKDHFADDTNQAVLDKSDLVIFLDETAHKEAAKEFRIPERYVVWKINDIQDENNPSGDLLNIQEIMTRKYNEITKNINNLAISLGLKK